VDQLHFGPLYFLFDLEVLRGGEQRAVGLLECAEFEFLLDHDAFGIVLDGMLVLYGLLQRFVIAVDFNFFLAGL
jgi:hypothetical protein